MNNTTVKVFLQILQDVATMKVVHCERFALHYTVFHLAPACPSVVTSDLVFIKR